MSMPLRQMFGAVFALLAATGMVMPAAAGEPARPGEGKEIRMGRATWNTGWFQAEIYTQLLEKLGYTVSKPVTVDNAAFYQAVGQGSIDMWVNGWFPNHNSYKDSYRDGARAIGHVAKGGALQGYLIDKATHEKHGIDNLADFKKPSVKKHFDDDGDGKAEMVACPPGWACEEIITHHLKAYGLNDHIDPIKAGYAAAMANALGRYKDGKSIFFYTWTPNWTVGELKPGADVVWLEVPEPNLPESQKNLEDATTVAGVTGCVDDPCQMGWPANDLRPVANKAFLDANPAVKTLLKVAGIPVADIFAQNAKMHAGEDSASDIARHAQTWIDNHPDKVEAWLTKARKAAAM